MSDEKTPLLLFDGHCNLCNATVDTFLRLQKKYDTKDASGEDMPPKLKFASLQSDPAQERLSAQGLSPDDFNQPDNPQEETVILFAPDGTVHVRSSAILRAVALVTPAWVAFFCIAILYLVPPFVRNTVYKQVAKNRLRIFGKTDTCRMASPAEKRYFLPNKKKGS